MLSDIVNGEDLKEAARRQAAYLQSSPMDRYNSVTMNKKPSSAGRLTGM
jgi:hypothetical protein